MRKSAAKVLEMRPVVAVEAIAYLWAHVAQRKSIIHGLLTPLCVCRGHLVASVIAAAEVVLELCAEHLWDGDVFHKDTVFPVCIVVCERFRGDVFSYPLRVSRPSVVRRCERGGGAEVVDRTRKAILEEAVGVDESSSSSRRRGDRGDCRYWPCPCRPSDGCGRCGRDSWWRRQPVLLGRVERCCYGCSGCCTACADQGEGEFRHGPRWIPKACGSQQVGGGRKGLLRGARHSRSPASCPAREECLRRVYLCPNGSLATATWVVVICIFSKASPALTKCALAPTTGCGCQHSQLD